MKKFAIIAYVGNHTYGDIECAARDVELIKDSDDRSELVREAMAMNTEYKSNGKWYSYHFMKRADARKELKRYGKM